MRCAARRRRKKCEFSKLSEVFEKKKNTKMYATKAFAAIVSNTRLEITANVEISRAGNANRR